MQWIPGSAFGGPRNDRLGRFSYPQVMRQYYVYVLASGKNGTLYVGVTNDLGRRVFDHREGRGSIFTNRYEVKSLVYYEPFDRIDEAITREKELKKWRREWKINLIQSTNPDWNDLYLTLWK